MIYLIAAILLIVAFYTKIKIVKYFCFFIIFFLGGARWQTGTDWPSYIDNFENLSSVEFEVQKFEPLFQLLSITSKSIFNSYTFFLFVQSLILFITLIWISLKSNRQLYIFIFTLIGFVYSGLLLNRYYLSFIFFSVAFLSIKKKRMKYFFYLISVLFHFTSLIPIFLILFNKKYLFFVGFLLLFAFYFLSKSEFYDLFKYSIYFDKVERERVNGFFVFAKLFFLLSPLLYSLRKNLMHFFSCLLLLFFLYFISIEYPSINRIFIYIPIILSPYYLLFLNKFNLKLVFLVIAVFLSYMSMVNSYPDLYFPFEFFWEDSFKQVY